MARLTVMFISSMAQSFVRDGARRAAYRCYASAQRVERARCYADRSREEARCPRHYVYLIRTPDACFTTRRKSVADSYAPIAKIADSGGARRELLAMKDERQWRRWQRGEDIYTLQEYSASDALLTDDSV